MEVTLDDGKTLKGKFYVDQGHVHVRTADGRCKWVRVGGFSEQDAAKMGLRELGPCSPPTSG